MCAEEAKKMWVLVDLVSYNCCFAGGKEREFKPWQSDLLRWPPCVARLDFRPTLRRQSCIRCPTQICISDGLGFGLAVATKIDTGSSQEKRRTMTRMSRHSLEILEDPTRIDSCAGSTLNMLFLQCVEVKGAVYFRISHPGLPLILAPS